MSGPVTLEFDGFKTEYGLMDCWLVVHGQRHHLEVFGAFIPFGGLLGFIRALDTNTLPHEFCWQEEECPVDFHATQSESGSDHFHLQIIRDEETIVDADFDRLQTAKSLLESLRRFALDCPEAGTDWQFPYFLIEDFERARAKGFVPNTDADPIQTANFVFEHFDDSGRWPFLPIVTPCTRKVTPSFYLWIGSRLVLHLHMGEGPRLWQLWFDFLEKISRAQMPIEAIFDCRKPREECENDLDYKVQPHTYGLHAEPAAHSGQFRLRIWQLSDDESDQQSLLNVRLERRQFIGAFMKSFDEFLHTDYLAYLAGNPNGFDLRTFPLGKIE